MSAIARSVRYFDAKLLIFASLHWQFLGSEMMGSGTTEL
jgi:hypothetical protein